MKTVLFQDFTEGRHLSCNVDQFITVQAEPRELAEESDDSKVITKDV